jgi:hypothetical protein
MSLRGLGSGSAARSALGAGFAQFPIMLTLLIVLLVLAALGGGLGSSRFGVGSWSPAAIILVILVIMALTGRL